MRPDDFIPSSPRLADDFRFEILNDHVTAFRSSTRLHLWSGGIYRDVGLALGKGLSAEQILAIVAPKHGGPEGVLALYHLTHESIVKDGSVNEGTRLDEDLPEIFGDLTAPYRTAIKFERRPGTSNGTHGPGYYVYGRGRDAATARMGCLAEAVERRSLHATGCQQIVRIGADRIGKAAVPLRSLLISGEPGFEERPVDWTVAYSLVSKSIRYVPAAFCFASWNGGTKIEANSTGCAAGPNVTTASLSGFFELVERDALRGWWLDRRPAHIVRTETFGSSLIDNVRQYLWERNRRLALLDITTIPEVPTFAALSFQNDGRGGVLGASAHFDALTAINSATLEMGMALNWAALIRFGSRSLTAEIKPELQGPVDWTQVRKAGDYTTVTDLDPTAGMAYATALMRHHGKDLLVVDLSSSGATLSIVRVIVPGLRRFNPGTMYELAQPPSRSSCG